MNNACEKNLSIKNGQSDRGGSRKVDGARSGELGEREEAIADAVITAAANLQHISCPSRL